MSQWVVSSLKRLAITLGYNRTKLYKCIGRRYLFIIFRLIYICENYQTNFSLNMVIVGPIYIH